MEEGKRRLVGLNHLKPGERGWIVGMSLAERVKRKLRDMGFMEGSLVECAYRSPFGDPTAYFVKGALIAVRGEEARQIQIEIGNGMGI